MEKEQLIIKSENNLNNKSPEIHTHKNTQAESKDEILKEAILSVEPIIVNPLLNTNQLKREEIQNLNLNVKIIRFLQILGGYNKLKIICNRKNCFIGCHSARSHQVIGINDRGEEHLLMTASQEALQSDSYGYMLVY